MIIGSSLKMEYSHQTRKVTRGSETANASSHEIVHSSCIPVFSERLDFRNSFSFANLVKLPI